MAFDVAYKTVELLPAFFWTCDDCGRDNFDRGRTLMLESIDHADLPELGHMEGVKVWVEVGGSGTLVLTPRLVRCLHCAAEFEIDSSVT